MDYGDQQLLIDGAWCDAQDGARLAIVDPCREEQIGTIADAGAADVQRAITAAVATFADGTGPWASTPVAERLVVLGRVLDALAARTREVGIAEAAHGGMTIRNATAVHATGGPIFVRQAIAQAPGDELQGLPLQEGARLSANYLRREPLGVVAALPPSNAGYLLGLYKTMAALATGNCVVLKPSPLCSLSAVEIARAIAAEPAIAPGAFALLLGGADAGRALVEHPRVDKISFTGSDATARRIMSSAAPHLHRLTFELGGKGPVLMLDDADLDVAIDGIVWGVLWQSGQTCIAGTRLLVCDDLHDEVLERLVARMERLTIGDTMDPATDLGPVVSAQARERIAEHVAAAVGAGARLVLGDRTPLPDRGFYVAPTILTDVDPASALAATELFGPVLAVTRYADVDEAVAIANGSSYGLSATVWSTDNARALAVAKRLRTGTVWINEHHALSPVAPFGGYRDSGLGREFGVLGLEAFTELKHVHVDLMGRADRPIWKVLLGS